MRLQQQRAALVTNPVGPPRRPCQWMQRRRKLRKGAAARRQRRRALLTAWAKLQAPGQHGTTSTSKSVTVCLTAWRWAMTLLLTALMSPTRMAAAAAAQGLMPALLPAAAEVARLDSVPALMVTAAAAVLVSTPALRMAHTPSGTCLPTMQCSLVS